MTSPDETRPLIRVGHKGADHVAPGNTARSFEAALELGVDMIEFDVMPLRDGTLVLAHDPEDATSRTPMRLEEGLDHFAAEAYNGIELDVDLKIPGYERTVVEGLRKRGLLERSLISSNYQESLDLVRELDPDVRRGLSVPKVKRDLRGHPILRYPAYAAVAWWRSGLPARAERALHRGECEALMSHYVLVTRQLVKRVRAAGGQLYVWTVDDADRIAKLEALGVDAVITNDPRLFG